MTSDARPRRVGIVGLGLMGGSLARGLRALRDPPWVVAYTADELDARRALDGGFIDVVAETPEAAARDQELVVYATPLAAALELMPEHVDVWGDATVTDVVSLKASLLLRARERGYAARYVGTHPMVGGTGGGFGASLPDLFVDEPVWLVRGDASEEHAARVEALWTSLRAVIRPTEAEDHDRLMVWASHLPQLVANALARALAGEGLHASELGPGGRDMTRLAGSAAGMWRDLLAEAAPENQRALESVVEHLEALRSALADGAIDDVAAVMEMTRDWRRDD